MRVICYFLSAFLLYSCSGNEIPAADDIVQASMNAIGKKEDRDKIQNLVTVADCVSPRGKYSTEIHTAAGGYSYFKQVYSFKPTPFEAVIEKKDTGHIIGDTVSPLSKVMIAMVRGHEFYTIILEADKRFHSFEQPILADSGTRKLYQIKAKDEWEYECVLFFEQETSRLSAIHSRNPAAPEEIIEISFSGWQAQQGFILPRQVTIKQGGQYYSFDFVKVLFNSPGFKKLAVISP